MEDKKIAVLSQLKGKVFDVALPSETVSYYPMNEETDFLIIKTREKCLYCGGKIENRRAGKKFCTTLHRTSYFRAKIRWINQQKKMAAEGNNS